MLRHPPILARRSDSARCAVRGGQWWRWRHIARIGASEVRRPPPLGRVAAVRRRRTVEVMTSDEQAGPDPYAEHPEKSVFPGAGERVSDADRQRALDAEPAGNATVGDMVDTDGVDSRAHEDGAGSQEVAEQVERRPPGPTDRLSQDRAASPSRRCVRCSLQAIHANPATRTAQVQRRSSMSSTPAHAATTVKNAVVSRLRRRRSGAERAAYGVGVPNSSATGAAGLARVGLGLGDDPARSRPGHRVAAAEDLGELERPGMVRPQVVDARSARRWCRRVHRPCRRLLPVPNVRAIRTTHRTAEPVPVRSPRTEATTPSRTANATDIPRPNRTSSGQRCGACRRETSWPSATIGPGARRRSPHRPEEMLRRLPVARTTSRASSSPSRTWSTSTSRHHQAPRHREGPALVAASTPRAAAEGVVRCSSAVSLASAIPDRPRGHRRQRLGELAPRGEVVVEPFAAACRELVLPAPGPALPSTHEASTSPASSRRPSTG